jgi:hypothetical protein
MTIKKAPPGTSLTSLEANVLIFGRIRRIENEEEVKDYSGIGDISTGFRLGLQILRLEDMKTGTISKVEKDGSFFALIPMGTYIIHRIDWGDAWGTSRFIPQVAFQVPEGQHSYYLGTLVVNIKTDRNILGNYKIKGLYGYIEDEESEAMKAFHKRYPQSEVTVSKALMTHDQSIPSIDELESQRNLLNIINIFIQTLYP